MKRRVPRSRGFTLPELMVSLVAGLIVTLAVVGLARTATTTFHEQVRSTASEMSLRLASQRLAGDLSRVAFMGTGNIRWDTGIARINTLPLPGGSGSRQTGLDNLAGIRLYAAGGGPAGNLARETDNALRPEAIDMTGNFTSNDQYMFYITTDPPSPVMGACAPQRIVFDNDDAAIIKIMRKLLPDGTTPARSDADAQTLLRAVFLPVTGSNFPARVTDSTGRTHFVVVTAATVVGGSAYLDLLPTNLGCSILVSGQADSGGAAGRGPFQIAPLQTVRWSVQRLANARLDPPEDANVKYDLIRQYIDLTGVAVGAAEIVAEYVVDLKFAFTVDRSPLVPTSVSFDFEDETNNLLWGAAVGGGTRAALSDPAPHRIRSVRFRLADRTAQPDRTTALPGPAAGYVLRYCLDGPPNAACVRYARVRTLTSEVAMMNQARMSY